MRKREMRKRLIDAGDVIDWVYSEYIANKLNQKTVKLTEDQAALLWEIDEKLTALNNQLLQQ